jgi:hypothetical protein
MGKSGAEPRPVQGLETNMQNVRPIAGRVMRFLFRKWLKQAEKLHYL